jgi:DNA-binding IclR family transcriptional regulator
MARGGSDAADKLLQTLLAFQGGADQSLGDLAGRVGLAKSTVHRLLTKLKEYGLVEQDRQTSLYRLGLRAWTLALRARPYEAMRREAHPHLARLARESGETAFLTVAEGIHSVCIDRVEGDQLLRVSMEVGSIAPLHLGASNRVLLAFLPATELDAALDRWAGDGEERRPLDADLVRIRERGFSFTTAQLTPGAAAIAVPVLDSKGGILCGLSVGGPAERFTESRAREFLPLLQQMASETAARLDRPSPHAERPSRHKEA